MALADMQALVTSLVRDDEDRIPDEDRDAAIALAVLRYSEDRPRRPVVDIVSDGQALQDLPEGWEPGFSALVSLEHPVGRIPPSLLHSEAFGVYDAPDGQKLAFVHGDLPPAGDAVRVTFLAGHQLTAELDTTPQRHREVIACYAASLLLDQLSTLMANAGDSTIQADSVDRRTKSQEYASRARAMRQRYLDGLGINAKKNVAAGVQVNLDQYDSRGRDRLTHPAQYR